MAGFVPESGEVSFDTIGRIYTNNSAPTDVSLGDNRYRDTVRKYSGEIKFSDFRGKGWGGQRTRVITQPEPPQYNSSGTHLNPTNGTLDPHEIDYRVAQARLGTYVDNGITRTGGAPFTSTLTYNSDDSALTNFDGGGYWDLRHESNRSVYTSTGFNFYIYTGASSFEFILNYRLYWYFRSPSYYPSLSIYALGNPTGYLDGDRLTLASKSESAQSAGKYENGSLNIETNASRPYTTIVFSFVTPPSFFYGFPLYTWYDREAGVYIGNLSCELD